MNGDEPTQTRPLVLIVDDEEAIRTALGRHLRRMGYDVVDTADGNEAITLVERLHPAVVLSDIHMPGMDGHELLRRLTAQGLPGSVILMSGQGELDDAISALREGAVDYLKKPWAEEELRKALDRALDLFGALRELNVPAGAGSPAQLRRGANLAGPMDAAARIEQLATAPALATLAAWDDGPALRCLRRLAGEETNAQEGVATCVEQDPRMAEAVLRMARATPAWTAGDSPDVRAALEALGADTAWAVTQAASLRELFPVAVPAIRTLNDRIWRFSVSRALAMQGIAGVADPEVALGQRECFQAGLLLDVGASYLLAALSKSMDPLERISDSTSMLAAITRHHAAVGARILQRWQLSAKLVELAREHHAEARASALSPLECATALGGAVAMRLAGFGDPTGDRVLRSDLLARCAYTLGVGDTGLRRLTMELSARANETWAAFG
ncbi:MAG TPA: response regulator [Polyangia bacterium]|jgi:CheY-like chemotaxis protein/HD-like signal output (HDOD) protein